jgi:hypothetical protein
MITPMQKLLWTVEGMFPGDAFGVMTSRCTNGQPSRYREPKFVERLETFRSDMCGGWVTKP